MAGGPQHVHSTSRLLLEHALPCQSGQRGELEDHGAGAGRAGDLEAVQAPEPGPEVDPGVGQARGGVEGGQESVGAVQSQVQQLAPVPAHGAVLGLKQLGENVTGHQTPDDEMKI